MFAQTRSYVWLLGLTLLGCRPELRAEGAVEYIADSRKVIADRQQLTSQIEQARLELETSRPPAPELEGWTALFSFVHVSDVQIRDAGIHYFSNSVMESSIDRVATSTKRHEKLDRNDEYPWAALVGGVNQLLRSRNCDKQPETIGADCPRFLIHTGDAIDAGTLGELNRFLSVGNRLLLPWYSVVGNHDIFLMGNFTESQILFTNMPTESVPLVLNRNRFMRQHGPTRWNETLRHEPTARGYFGMPASLFHGFDTTFATQDLKTSPTGEDRPLRGYYSLRFGAKDKDQNPTSWRLIVLDTTEQHRMVKHAGSVEIPISGALGYVEPEQYEWFKQEILSAEEKGELVLVAGHHPLLAPPDLGSKLEQLGDLRGTDPSGTRNIALKALFAEHPNMLGYFGGHTHLLRLARIPRSHAVEVTAPSLHELPQVAFLITMYQQEKGRKLGMLVQSTHGVPGRDDLLAERLKEGCEGALLDKKKKIPEAGPNCGVSVSQFFVLGDPPKKPAICSGSADPAAEPIYRPASDLTETIETDFAAFGQMTLRGLLPLLSKNMPCIHFWMSPEVAEAADFKIDVSELANNKFSVSQLLSLLLAKIPAVGPKHDIKLDWQYRPEGGIFQIVRKPVDGKQAEPPSACTDSSKLKLLPMGVMSKPTLRSLLTLVQDKLPCIRFSLSLEALDWLDLPIPSKAMPTESLTVEQMLSAMLPNIRKTGKESERGLRMRVTEDQGMPRYLIDIEPPTANRPPN